MGKGPIVASVLIRNMEGLVLVLEAQDQTAALPGGTCEFGETPEETAVRETFEETGLRVTIEGTVALYNLLVLNKDGTERCKFRHCLFLASTTDTDPRPGSEWEDSEAKCTWIRLEDLARFRGVWPLPEEVRTEVSAGKLDLGSLGELRYQMG